MSAHAFEAEEAREEGVRINWLRTIKEMDEQSITVEIMRVNEHGELVGTGELETLEADSLILAPGRKSIPRYSKPSWTGAHRCGHGSGGSRYDLRGRPVCRGDMIPAERSITQATGHGERPPDTLMPG